MAFDERLQRCAGSLRSVLKPEKFVDLLREKNVLTEAEHTEVVSVNKSRGSLEGNRCLIRHLMIGKSRDQVKTFFEIILAKQRAMVEPILRKRLDLDLTAYAGIDDSCPEAGELLAITDANEEGESGVMSTPVQVSDACLVEIPLQITPTTEPRTSRPDPTRKHCNQSCNICSLVLEMSENP